jgi:hypothetical protein
MRYIITESQYKLLNENLSSEFRRRLPFENMMNDLEWGVLDDMSNICDYNSIGDFVSDACDNLVELSSDYFSNEYGKTMSPKDKDTLYYYFVDKFGKYLVKYYNTRCK